jgi:hypothetical protein
VQGIVDTSYFISFCNKNFCNTACKNKSYKLCILYLLLPLRRVKKVKEDSATAMVGG